MPQRGIPALQSSAASRGVTNPGYRPDDIAATWSRVAAIVHDRACGIGICSLRTGGAVRVSTSVGQLVHSFLHAVENVILADELGQPQLDETLLRANRSQPRERNVDSPSA